MRILTWNCNGAFRRKVHLLEPFEADILVIQECEEPSQGHAEYLSWAGQHIWAGTNKQKGLAIFARKDHTITPLSWPDAGTSLFLPVMVNDCLQVLGVWTQIGSSTQGSYIGQFWHYLQVNQAEFSHNTIVCGDFNSNTRWDKPRSIWSHSKCVAELEALGLVSLYHQLNGEAQGEEQTPTFFLQRNQSKPYHIDYAFSHESTFPAGSAKIWIGDPDEWLGHSDHMPIVFEF
jgi:exonuclease III